MKDLLELCESFPRTRNERFSEEFKMHSGCYYGVSTFLLREREGQNINRVKI